MLRSLLVQQSAVATRHFRFHRPAFFTSRWMSTAGGGTGSDENENNGGDDLTEWIPPNRPLSASNKLPEYYTSNSETMLSSSKEKSSSTTATLSRFREKLINNDEIDMEEYERIIRVLEEAETGELNDEEVLYDKDGFIIDYDSDDDDDDVDVSMGEFDKDGNLILDDDVDDIPIEEFEGSEEEWDEYMRQIKELEDDDDFDDTDDGDAMEYYDAGHDDDDDDSLQQEAKLVEKMVDDSSEDQAVDWAAIRRSKMNAVEFMTPDQAQKARQNADLPVIKHTLLSADEIISCLETLGGTEITFLAAKHGLLDEAEGLILATGSHPAQVRLLAEAVARNLKARDLADLGVIGACLGPEAADKHDTWQVVDCRNYIVHIFDDRTREALQLEKLWGPRPSDNLRNVNANNDDAVDDYVAANPVPANYNPGGDKENWENAMARLQRTNWVKPIAQGTDKQKRKKKKRRRAKR